MAGSPAAGGRCDELARLVAGAVGGERLAVARLLSLVENAPARWQAIGAALAPHSGAAEVVGLTGAPGVGKSTTTSALVRAYRDAGRRVGVLAVDPSSPLSGGALLGDRVRMTEHAGDPGVFVRSLASRGSLGGLAIAAAQALRVLDAAGFDLIIVETIGVGQAEIDIASLADTTCVLLAPGAGDGVQAVKAGLLEIADVLVVNKVDQPGAERTVTDLTAMTRMRDDDRRPAVVRLAAAHGQGVDDLVERIAEHRRHLVATGGLDRRRLTRAADEIRGLTLHAVRERLAAPEHQARLAELARAATAGTVDPWSAARRLLAEMATAPGEPPATR
ncbi:methylmalonyl Co-A mutase-associated GTPase MeaB [Frankia sp. AgB32]|uniref:methylmalonyl Co-A mutase-associated GTPase MeaB n=1 Tax=Frankia sp. AgB32 TaxID=631119 RepID=UPI00200EDC0D|nr:methylmalonyl Co-A mutase-associated GTPase MeaB [Frankia sp. AgB32]MCK9896142.1 methylmalonyl Co-A mutase-associated GTPase MeaB [Frankia sp. AgB32]